VADKTSQQIDFPALGQIIYEWVLHLPLGHEQREVQPSDEWSRLGRNGERWRALCADLLNGDGPAAPQSLDELEQRVAALKPPVFTMKRAAVAAAILALLTPASLMAYNRIWLQTPPGRWRTLCENYVNWVEPLATQIADRKLPPTGDPELDELIKRCRKENHWFHPSRILYGDDASTARQVLEDEASFEKLKAKGPQQIQRAQEAASQVERLGDELKKKNVMMAQTVGEVQQRLVKQMPNVRVVQIDELKKDFVLSSDFGRLFINRVAALPMLQRLAAQLKVLQEETGIIQSDQVASKEPLLKQFAAFQDAEVSRSPQVANLAALSERLKTLQSLASEIHTAIDGPWSARAAANCDREQRGGGVPAMDRAGYAADSGFVLPAVGSAESPGSAQCKEITD
jgi:hypothetical protein